MVPPLIQPVCSWKTDRDFMEASEKVRALLIVNNLVERGVKLLSGFQRESKEGREVSKHTSNSMQWQIYQAKSKKEKSAI